MKRRGPLRRGKPLQRGGALKPGKPLARTGRLQSRPRPPQGELDRRASEAWHHYVLMRARGRCQCGGRGCRRDPSANNQLHAHHVLPQEYIRRHVRSLGLPEDEARQLLRSLLWDRRNGLALLYGCHRRHHSGHQRVAQAVLLPEHRQFADELGLAYVLERLYAA